MAIRAEEIEEVAGRVDIDRDRLLVLRHQRGDAEAFDELYRRYHPRLVLYCRRRVGDSFVAEELAQEAFLRALRAMPEFGGDRRFYPWMTVIAQRLCIDHHRRAARVEPASDVDPGTVEADHDALYAAVDRAHLDEALGRLAPRHREVLDLREQKGWSYHDIATHLAVPMTTVEALLHRARKALRREYLAVAGGDRGAAVVVPVAGLGLLARLKRAFLALHPEQLAPALGAAAAGVAALGFVAGPIADGTTQDGSRATTVVSTRPAAAVAPADAPLPGVLDAPAVAVDTSGTTTESAPTTAATATPPPSSIDLGVTTVYPGAEGASYVDQRIECMPIQIDLRPVANFGLDLAALLDPDPAGSVSTDPEDCS
jgi:RNA polymerase sigma-70 factor (ECF subfamily)